MTTKIFIGSSQEQHDRQIVPTLARILGQHGVKPIPWCEAFSANEYTLEALIENAKHCDAAVFVFGADDILTSRDVPGRAVRDNVLIEYGLFVGVLERPRVFLLREKGVRVPSDLAGISRIDFQPQTGAALEKEIERCADEIHRKLEQLGPRDITSKDYFGVPETLRKYRVVADAADDFLRGRHRTPSRFARNPVHFDSFSSALEAYQQGLRRVERRFWTTSFLHSGFWAYGDLPLRLNEDLLKEARLRGAPIEMRRLLLLESSPPTDIEAFGKRIRMLHRLQRDSEISILWDRLKTIKERHMRLVREGCETRVNYCDPRQRRIVIGSQTFNMGEVEVAVYDDFRLDFFGSSSNGQVTDVKMFVRGIEDFDSALLDSILFFEDLWDKSSLSLESFFSRLEHEFDQSMRRIYHVENWIFKYHQTLSDEDEDLKKREIGRARRLLEEACPGRIFQGHLDIGTCTGRYALEWRDLVADNGRISGVDIDRDCIQYILRTHRGILDGDQRLEFSVKDFLSDDFEAVGEFDLITCMMGTLSYFGYGCEKGRLGSLLQGAINKMSVFLSSGGLLILSKWSQRACADLDLIDIYTGPAKRRLAAWTPSTRDLIEGLEKSGFSIRARSGVTRLEIIICEKI